MQQPEREQVVSMVLHRYREVPKQTSLLHPDGVDLKTLEKLSVTEAKLNQEQREAIYELAFAPALKRSEDNPAPDCYIPLHLFVGYDAEGKAVMAFEVCFQCGRADAWPNPLEKNTDEFGFGGLAEMVQALGIQIKPD